MAIVRASTHSSERMPRVAAANALTTLVLCNDGYISDLDLTDVALSTEDGQGANLSHAVLWNATFESCDLRGVRWDHCWLFGSLRGSTVDQDLQDLVSGEAVDRLLGQLDEPDSRVRLAT